MKIIITGASGFVGQNLTEYLKGQNHKVEDISLPKDWTLDTTADTLIHLAGKAHDTANTSADDVYFKINTELTKTLFDEFLKSEIKDFLCFSSVKAVADTVNGILDENHKPDPKTAYGKSKLAAEAYILSKNLPAEKRVFIIRPCMIHGPGNKGNLNLLYKIVEKGIPWPLAAFENKRSLLSIDNLNFLVAQIISSKELPSGIYNFADDESLSTNALVKIIAESSGRKAKLIEIPAGIISTVAKIGDNLKLPLNSERLKKLTENYEVSNQKIKSALGIEKLPITAEEGLMNTIKSFKK